MREPSLLGFHSFKSRFPTDCRDRHSGHVRNPGGIHGGVCPFGADLSRSFAPPSGLLWAMMGLLLAGVAGKALAASCLDGVSVFGGPQIELRDRVEIASGTAFSNGTSGNGIVVGNDAKTRDLKSGSDIILGDRSTALGSATAGGTVALNSGASVSGAIHEGVNIPLCEIPEEPDFQTGSESHDVWNSNTLELSPGEYDEVQVFSNSTLKLESGTYSFNLLRFEADAILELNTNDGTVEILVENSLSFGDRTLYDFSGGIQAPSRIKFYSGQTSTVHVGTDVNFYGTLIAPLAQVKAFSRTVSGERYMVNP